MPDPCKYIVYVNILVRLLWILSVNTTVLSVVLCSPCTKLPVLSYQLFLYPPDSHLIPIPCLQDGTGLYATKDLALATEKFDKWVSLASMLLLKLLPQYHHCSFCWNFCHNTTTVVSEKYHHCSFCWSFCHNTTTAAITTNTANFITDLWRLLKLLLLRTWLLLSLIYLPNFYCYYLQYSPLLPP